MFNASDRIAVNNDQKHWEVIMKVFIKTLKKI